MFRFQHILSSVSLALALAAVTVTVHAQDTDPDDPATKPAEEPKVMQILKAADEATKKIEAIRYEAEFTPTGVLAARAPIAKGTVLKSVRDAASPFAASIYGEGWFFEPRPEGGRESNFKAAFDGTNITRLDPDRKRYWQGTSTGGGAQQILGPVANLNMIEFGHPTPFQDEINGKVQEYEGQTMVHDVLCDVVYVEYDITPAQSARWYFGAEDHLPRRVERLQTVNGRAGALVLTARNLDLNPQFEEEVFTIEVPEGYERGRVSSGGPVPTANPVGIGGGR